MIRIAICDDNSAELNEIRSIIVEYGNARDDLLVDCFASGEELLRGLKKSAGYDLYILDILMSGMSGLDLAKALRERHIEDKIVFLTHSRDYALEAYGVQAVQYLLKPIDRAAFNQLLQGVFEEISREKNRYFIVNASDGRYRVRYASIVYIESIHRTLCFHLLGGRVLTSRTIRVPIVQAIDPILKDRRFLYEHKSFIVNMAHVQALTSTSFIMVDQTVIPIPRYKYAVAKRKYMEYLSQSNVYIMEG